MIRIALFFSLSLHIEDLFLWWNNLEHSYLFMAMMWRKWGAINLNIGCDGERHLLAAMQIPSIRKCVLPSRGEKVLNDSFLNCHFCSFFFFTKLEIHKIDKKKSINSFVLKHIILLYMSRFLFTLLLLHRFSNFKLQILNIDPWLYNI